MAEVADCMLCHENTFNQMCVNTKDSKLKNDMEVKLLPTTCIYMCVYIYCLCSTRPYELGLLFITFVLSVKIFQYVLVQF